MVSWSSAAYLSDTCLLYTNLCKHNEFESLKSDYCELIIIKIWTFDDRI